MAYSAESPYPPKKDIVAARPVDYGRRNYDPQKTRYEIARRRNLISRRIFERPAVIFTLFSVAATGALFGTAEAMPRPKNQTPYFRTTEILGCSVSEDYTEVLARPRRGLDDLVLRGNKNITAETGPGSECLVAAKVLVEAWSQSDGVPGNDIIVDSNNPTVFVGYKYRVPLEATPLHANKNN